MSSKYTHTKRKRRCTNKTDVRKNRPSRQGGDVDDMLLVLLMCFYLVWSASFSGSSSAVVLGLRLLVAWPWLRVCFLVVWNWMTAFPFFEWGMISYCICTLAHLLPFPCTMLMEGVSCLPRPVHVLWVCLYHSLPSLCSCWSTVAVINSMVHVIPTYDILTPSTIFIFMISELQLLFLCWIPVNTCSRWPFIYRSGKNWNSWTRETFLCKSGLICFLSVLRTNQHLLRLSMRIPLAASRSPGSARYASMPRDLHVLCHVTYTYSGYRSSGF